jgi:hypothetical protein
VLNASVARPGHFLCRHVSGLETLEKGQKKENPELEASGFSFEV